MNGCPVGALQRCEHGGGDVPLQGTGLSRYRTGGDAPGYVERPRWGIATLQSDSNGWNAVKGSERQSLAYSFIATIRYTVTALAFLFWSALIAIVFSIY